MFKVWFFKWVLVGNSYEFSFTNLGEESGATEIVPKTTDNLEKRLGKVTKSGVIASFIAVLLGIPPLFMTDILPFFVFALWACFLPVGIYFFMGNLLPVSADGYRNDGAVLYGLKHKDAESQVTINLLKIHSELYNGKTPSQISEDLYFNLPQIQEDNPYFSVLLNARYVFYLDKGDYDNAKKITERLLSLVKYMPKQVKYFIIADALYNACTFYFNENKAENYLSEIESFLNKVNNATNIRIKLAYILFVSHKKDLLEDFYNQGIKEASKCQLKGLGLFEEKLLNNLKQNF